MSERTLRIASLIQQELSRALLSDAKDPRARAINITSVTVTRDLSIAKVRYLLLSTEEDPKKVERAKKQAQRTLETMIPFLRRTLAKHIGSLRIVPQLRFYWDDAIEHGRHMENIFQEIKEHDAKLKDQE